MNRPEEQMQAIIAAQAAEWFVAHRDGEMSDAQRAQFIDWLAASPAHVREYLALSGLAEDLVHAAARSATPADVLLALARQDDGTVIALDVDREQESHRDTSAPTNGRLWSTFGGLMAAAIAALALGLWWFDGWTRYSTGHAEQHSWRMPDGSTVHLNTDSQIKVRFDEHRRDVEISRGQAMFQVAKDAARPFRVRVGNAVVEAVGTEFDVYRQQQRTLISVVEGKVAVWRAGAAVAQPIDSTTSVGSVPSLPVARLSAGQQLKIDRSAAIVSSRAADVHKTVAWLQRQVVFDHDPLGAVADEFNRYNELQIHIGDETLRRMEISGIFGAYDTQSFLSFLERQPGMRVERNGNRVTITKNAAAQ